MFNPAKEMSAWIQHVAAYLARMDVRLAWQETNEYASALGTIIHQGLDQQQEMVDLACRLTDAKSALRAANARAHRNACAGLLALGLFAVQAYGLALYFLPN